MKEIISTLILLLVLINLNSCKKEEEKKEFTLSLSCDLIENKTGIENQIIGEWNVVELEEIDSRLAWNYNTEVQYFFNDNGKGRRVNPQDDSVWTSTEYFSYQILEKTETGWEIIMHFIQPNIKTIQICENELLFVGAEKCIRN